MTIKNMSVALSKLFINFQAREEYRVLKHRKQVEWAVNIIQRHYIRWKVSPLITCCTNKLLNREIYCAHTSETLGILHDVMLIT